MNCVKAQQLIRPYLEGYLSDRELEEFLNHVQTCPDCFDELEVYFSIFRTLNDVDEKGDYNFRKKLRRKLENSRAYLRRRNQTKGMKAAVILFAEFALVAAFWGLLSLPGGIGQTHRTDDTGALQTEYESAAVTEAQTIDLTEYEDSNE